MAYYLKEINECCRKDAVGFIRECDELFEKKLEHEDDMIKANM